MKTYAKISIASALLAAAFCYGGCAKHNTAGRTSTSNDTGNYSSSSATAPSTVNSTSTTTGSSSMSTGSATTGSTSTSTGSTTSPDTSSTSTTDTTKGR